MVKARTDQRRIAVIMSPQERELVKRTARSLLVDPHWFVRAAVNGLLSGVYAVPKPVRRPQIALRVSEDEYVRLQALAGKKHLSRVIRETILQLIADGTGAKPAMTMGITAMPVVEDVEPVPAAV